MRSFGKKLAEALTFAVVMTIFAWFEGRIAIDGARPLWFQVTARLVIYTAIFFVVSLAMDAIFSRLGKK